MAYGRPPTGSAARTSIDLREGFRTFTDYARYYLPWLMQCAAALGIVSGGLWTWAGFATLPVLALVDALLPVDLEPRRMRHRALANVPIWLCAVSGPALYLLGAWKIGTGDLSAVGVAGVVASTAWLTVVPLVSAAHELYHQRGMLAQFVGTYVQVCYLDCTRSIAHMIGHHIHVGTARDSDTARRGVSLYAFTPRAIVESTKETWRIENEALIKRGYGAWNWRHRFYRAVLAQIIFQAIVFALGGLAAVAAALGGMIVARVWVEAFNYFQHYGQVRVEGAPIGRRHVWNHLGMLTRPAAFEITNHADHHLDSYIPYYLLKPDRDAIVMPNVFVCFLAALAPPVWHGLIIKPALRDWDTRLANAEERGLARAQNQAAGWEDWYAAEADARSGVAAE